MSYSPIEIHVTGDNTRYRNYAPFLRARLPFFSLALLVATAFSRTRSYVNVIKPPE